MPGCRVEPAWLGSVSTREGDRQGCIRILAGFPLAHWPCTWSGWEVRKRGEGRWLTGRSCGLALVVGACPGIQRGGEPCKAGIAHRGTHLGPLLLVAVPRCRRRVSCFDAWGLCWRRGGRPMSWRGRSVRVWAGGVGVLTWAPPPRFRAALSPSRFVFVAGRVRDEAVVR